MVTIDHNFKIKNGFAALLKKLYILLQVWKKDGANMNIKQTTPPTVGAT